MPSSLFTEYLKRAVRYVFSAEARKARQFITEQARDLDVKPHLFRDPANLEIGKLYLFTYNPKWKHRLPYWDRHPIIFPLNIQADRFLGLNLHYLPPRYRAILMDELYDHANTKILAPETIVATNYRLFQITRNRYFKPCVHLYLNNFVTSRFLVIPATEWKSALLMPTQRFEGPRASDVWDDSISKIGVQK